MGQPIDPAPVLLLLAAFSRHEVALDWARERAGATWGAIALESPAFPFHQTPYYDASMGPGLRKVFFACASLADPGALAQWKLATNAWEMEYAEIAGHEEPRPLNLDPGYLTLGKLVLASTKDYAHRIYLGRGIYAEITLFYRKGHWQHHEWTFPDYRCEAYQEFFSQCRDHLHQELRRMGKERMT